MPALTRIALVIAGSAFISIYALIKFVLFISKPFVVVVVVVLTPVAPLGHITSQINALRNKMGNYCCVLLIVRELT